MAALPYVTAPGNVEKALLGIKSAATPERVTQDFVKTILKVPGGSGDQITSFLRKLGFANGDGSPSDIYKKFRNSATAGRAAADALKIAYAPLYKRNEFMHCLNDHELKGLIIEETGSGNDSVVLGLIVSAINAVKKFAKFEESGDIVEEPNGQSKSLYVPETQQAQSNPTKLGMNLSYTINLNLPATSALLSLMPSSRA